MTSPRPTSDARTGSAQIEIEESRGELAALVKTYLPDALTISIVSLNGCSGGQLILHNPAYDKFTVAGRLRACAAILENSA